VPKPKKSRRNIQCQDLHYLLSLLTDNLGTLFGIIKKLIQQRIKEQNRQATSLLGIN